MAKVIPIGPIQAMSGHVQGDKNVFCRIRNGKTFTYTLVNRYDGAPRSEAQAQTHTLFKAVNEQVKAEMADPQKVAVWQVEYEKQKKCTTLRNYVFSTLYARAKAEAAAKA